MPISLIPLSSLESHPANPRRGLEPEHIQQLAQSMKEHKQWDPLIVRPLPDGRFEIVAGHCRTAAARSLGWESIRADVRDLSDEETAFLLVDTNMRRRSLSEVEEAEGIRRLMDAHNWSLRKVAESFGKSHPWVMKRLSLLDLAPEVQEQVVNRVTTATHGATIAQAPADVQPAIARKVVQADLSTRQTEHLVKVVMDPATPADVRKAVLESPKVTPEHAAEIAKLPTEIERQGIIKAVESGQLTPEETARKVEAANEPRTVTGERARRHLEVGRVLLRAREALEEIEPGDIAQLDAQALGTTEAMIRNLGARLEHLLRWTVAAQGRQQERNGDGKGGKVLAFPESG